MGPCRKRASTQCSFRYVKLIYLTCAVSPGTGKEFRPMALYDTTRLGRLPAAYPPRPRTSPGDGCTPSPGRTGMRRRGRCSRLSPHELADIGLDHA